MIKKFSVENFRGFSTKLVFDLAAGSYGFNNGTVYNGIVKNATIFGINGSGKSSLGVALFDIVRILTDKERMSDDYILPYTNLNNNSAVASFEYEFVFGTDNVKYSYKKLGPDAILSEVLEVNGVKKVEYHHNNSTDYYIAPDCGEGIIVDTLKGEVSILKYIKSRTPSNKIPIIDKIIDYANRMLWYRSLSNGNNYAGFKNGTAGIAKTIKEKGLERELEEFLGKFGLHFKLGFDPNDAEPNLLCYFPDGRTADFYSIASTGTKTLLLLFFWSKVAFKEASFVFVDEFDAFFHYSLSEDVVKMFNEIKTFQTVLTTHNVALLDNSLTRPDCSYIIGNNEIRKLSECTDRVLREAHNLEKMYVNGAFN